MTEGLFAITPIDGRYKNKVSELKSIFSEFGMISRRVDVEVEYFIFLSTILPELSDITDADRIKIRDISKNFDINEAKIVKEIEKKTRHDVKAVEYYLRIKFEDIGLDKHLSFIHFGLTSEDINSVVYVLQLWDFRKGIYSDCINNILKKLLSFSKLYEEVPMLSRTHGQAATPTTVGKEFMVYYERIRNQYNSIRKMNFKTKFGGAIGKLNAHVVAYPDIDWNYEMDEFIKHYAHGKDFMMTRNRYTTQIDHYENYSQFFDIIKRINTILIDLCVDMWMYISMDYFKMRVVEGEVGSSAMPHKVNPIMFENAEGNLHLSNTLLNFLSMRLPISRLQRDLTGSTILRNMGTAFSYTIISYKNILTGLDRVSLNEIVVLQDLKKNPVVLAEAIQSILRSKGYENSYEIVKSYVRSEKHIDEKGLHKFINGLEIDDRIKNRLLCLSVIKYIGV